MTEHMIKTPKKLIEVALPLDDINTASAKEKSIRHGHPSTLHLWWARRPLAAARAVIFAQMVNDPGYQQGEGFKYGVNKKDAEIKREKLFAIIRDLVKWENINNEEVLNRAREAIRESWRETCELNKNHPQADELFNPDKLPAFHDPFAGGGAIPLEAQRLGLESYASDLNPVAVMINKAMIEIPPKFSGLEPVGPIPEGEKQKNLMDDWSGAHGLAEDVRRYGAYISVAAKKRLTSLYPKVEHQNKSLDVVAWIWARTVRSPSPAFSKIEVPLISNYFLCTKKHKQAWLEPVISGSTYSFIVKQGQPDDPKAIARGTKTGRATFACLLSGATITPKYIKEEGENGRIGSKLIAIVASDGKQKLYFPPDSHHEDIAKSAKAEWRPQYPTGTNTRHMTTILYGLDSFDKLFTERQLVALNCFCELVKDIHSKVRKDALNSGRLNQADSILYADAITTYLTFGIGKGADYWSNLCTWASHGEYIGHVFTEKALQMVWDFAETNPIGTTTGCWNGAIDWIVRVLQNLPAEKEGHSIQHDATKQLSRTGFTVISTDPPYYDNVPYADISDFFYVWHRKVLKSIYNDEFATVLVPKEPELVVDEKRKGGKEAADSHFMNGMTSAVSTMIEESHPGFPLTIYYAFKSSDTKNLQTASAGWETFLQSIINTGLEVTGTWPLNTELQNRRRGIGSNALASSIVLVCRKRDRSADTISRRNFQRILREEMPEALETMIGGETGQTPIAPVDLAQSAIGPGIAIFSKYKAVLNQDGSHMSVHDALVLINRAITDYLNPESGSFDADTQFCSGWFDQYGWSSGAFGEADTLARAKGTSVDGVHDAGVIESGGGKVRLLKWEEYPEDWDPKTDNRTPVWEAAHHLIRALNQQGEASAGALLARMPERGEAIRQLAYHLYTLCERKGWAEDARAYNELIGAWHAIVTASIDAGHIGTQTELEM